ncbi:MAG: Rpn family recombination-promoting nuclease/putative transposase [Cyanobacteria bacterium P01_H01_bin.15]
MPALFFELIAESVHQNYRFDSVEVKQTAFRIDGVFLPQVNQPETPVYFVEVQFQKDSNLYARVFSELTLYLKYHSQVENWRVVLIYASRDVKQDSAGAFAPMLELEQVRQIYLDELPDEPTSLSLQLFKLIVEPEESAPAKAQKLVAQAQNLPPELITQGIIELVVTIMVYKLPKASREEIEKMIGLARSIKETRVYQEARQEGLLEGRQEGRQEGQLEGRREEALTLILRQLNRRFSAIQPGLQKKLGSLSLTQLESLSEALLDFSTISDLEAWLPSPTLSSDESDSSSEEELPN